jgi:hypothetical protein
LPVAIPADTRRFGAVRAACRALGVVRIAASRHAPRGNEHERTAVVHQQLNHRAAEFIYGALEQRDEFLEFVHTFGRRPAIGLRHGGEEHRSLATFREPALTSGELALGNVPRHERANHRLGRPTAGCGQRAVRRSRAPRRAGRADRGCARLLEQERSVRPLRSGQRALRKPPRVCRDRDLARRHMVERGELRERRAKEDCFPAALLAAGDHGPELAGGHGRAQRERHSGGAFELG